ncbi:hypothetical protein F4677DRAFT_49089 [Hypoxylon crocopeplum]|nr:hypothetical protein F4677DRAFT_49089 [Hypoxylon crocopeplum]
MPSKTEDVSGTPVTPDNSLGDAINKATRTVHTKLNTLIIQRLALALPPQAEDSSNYVEGLLHITPIYTAFETAWQAFLDSPESKEPRYSRIHSILSELHLPGLSRSAALHRDLASLTGGSPDLVTEKIAEAVAESSVVAAFIAHIKSATAAKPHVLVAYGFVLYMAIFSGGRFIRASLERVDRASGFWVPLLTLAEPEAAGMPGRTYAFALEDGEGRIEAQERRRRDVLQWRGEEEGEMARPLDFFRFDTPADGEDLRTAFKARLAQFTAPSPLLPTTTTDSGNASSNSSEDVLTTQEQDDITQEAQAIFVFMIRVVGELDEVCGTEYEEAAARASGRPLSLRSRDSVVVEKEKRGRLAAAAAGAGRRVGGANANGNSNGNGVSGETLGAGKGAVRFT